MNQEAQQKLNAILNKDISSVTQADRIFLKARMDYLTSQQREVYFKTEKKELSYRELYAKAKEMGIKTRVGMKREELIALVG